jgi:transposase
VLSVEDWAEIRRLHRGEGLPIRVIARVLGVSRNTVRAAVASNAPPRYERPRSGPIVDAVEPRIRPHFLMISGPGRVTPVSAG